MSFPIYPNYKDSGVEWWGDMPGAWGLFPAKRSFIRKKELNRGMKCENRLSLTLGGVVPRDLDDLDGLQASEFETYQIFSADDLVFKLIDLQNIKTSRVGLVPEMGIMSPAYIRIEPNKAKVAPKFAYWFFTNLYNRCIFNELGVGVRQTISSEELLLLPYPAFPIPEQTQIATFLDRETAKIDELVAEQHRLMELLKEKRQAVISHAVTKGLNPDAPMKPSGIEWLGDVPAHWERTPIKYVAKVGNGSTPSREIQEYWGETGFPWLNSSVVNSSVVTKAEGFVTERALRECHLPVIVPPAILVGITGQGRTRGMAAMLGIEATINQHVAYVKPSMAGLDVHYLLRVLESAYLKLRRDSEEAGATKGAITCEQIKNLHVPLPPLVEQCAISAFLDTESAKFNSLTAEAQRAIDLLQERRTALISAAVTGQIDVRAITSYEL